LWLHPAFVNDFGVAFIQPCCNYIQPSMISNISKINMISIISNISYSPGRRWPEYSSSTETNAHECLFCPTSVKRYPFEAQKLHEIFLAGVWTQSLDD
jgi:hypothetical protein